MYAVIETGGKQYLVEEGTTLRVERLAEQEGKEVAFDKVILVGGKGTPQIGSPYIDGANVMCKLITEGRDRKITVYHKKRRKGYEKKYGHRQPYSEVKVTKINA